MSFLQNVLQKEKEKGEKEGGETERERMCVYFPDRNNRFEY